MLVLSRKNGETIVLGEGDDEVTIVVSRIRREHVSLGIMAPRSVNVRRGELAPRPRQPLADPQAEGESGE